MTNERLYETYGFKAHRDGFFPEWQMETSTIVRTYPEIDRAEAAYKAYQKIHKNRVSKNL